MDKELNAQAKNTKNKLSADLFCGKLEDRVIMQAQNDWEASFKEQKKRE
jgi:hypothetical protein